MSTTDIGMSETQEEFIPTRNYTNSEEKSNWYYIKRWSKDYKSCWFSDNPINKETFRTRRDCWGFNWPPLWKQSLRARIGNSDDLGSLSKLTNTYLLIGGETETENFCRTVEGDLPDIKIVNCSISGCRTIGCLCVGNKNGLLVPDNIYETELTEIKEHLPDSVEVRKIEEKLSALGNVICCNDNVAIIHPDLDPESVEIIQDTLQVEVFRTVIANNPLVGSNCVLNNHGGLVHVDTDKNSLENLTSLLNLHLVAGTINYGHKTVASGLIANDALAYAGMKTTGTEFTSIDEAFHLKK